MKNNRIHNTAPTETREQEINGMVKFLDDIDLERELLLDTETFEPGSDKDRSPLSIVVVTAVSPEPQPWLKEAMSSFIRATENVTANVSWVIAGGQGVNFRNIEKVTGYLPVAPGKKVEPGEIMVVETPGYCPSGIARNIALMSVPETAWVVNLGVNDELTDKRLALINDYEHLDFHYCAVDNIVETTPGQWERSGNRSPRNSRILTQGWFERSRIDGGGVLDFCTESIAIRAKVLKKVGGYPGVPYCEGTILAKKLDDYGFAGAMSDEIGYLYRRRDDTVHGDTGTSDRETMLNFWTG